MPERIKYFGSAGTGKTLSCQNKPGSVTKCADNEQLEIWKLKQRKK